MWGRLLLLAFLLAIHAVLWAENVPVRFPEGLTHGFLSVSDEGGKKIGDGELQQVVQGDRVTNHLAIRFNDGSRYDDSTIFTQAGVFHLLSDHLTEQGPSFKTPLETTIDTSNGQVTVRYKDAQGKDKTLSKHMQLPPDLANGLLYVLVKDMNPRSDRATVSYLAATPEPRLVKLVFTRQGKDTFATGGVRREAEHYVIHVVIGGLTGVVARWIGKQPPNTDMWVIGGAAPAFAASRGPLDGNGRVWNINLVSPVLAGQSVTSPH